MKKNVVRVLALVLVALMCLSLVPLAAHAEAHVHEMAEDHQDPTCVDNGFNQTYCPICGATFSMEYIPATGIHSFMNVVDEQYLILEGDCEHAYQYWKSCSVCQQSAEEAYAKALDAMYEDLNNRKNSGEQADWEQIVKDRVLLLDEKYKFSYGGEGHHYIHVDHQEATCTSDGWKEYSYCDVCGEYFNYEVIPAKGHRWGEYTQTKAPTCTEAGEKVRVCEVCDEKDVVVLPALGHAWGEFKVTKEATCTEDGSRERVCSVCNEKEIQVIPAAHKFGEYVVTLEPTCFVDGSRERVCTVCGHKEVEAIPAAHTYGEFTVTQEPTCYSTGAKTATCTVCGEEHTEWIDMVPHKYENGECVFCHAAMPEGYVAPSDDRTEITETAGSETETTDNQTTEPETADNQAAEPETADNQAAEPETADNQTAETTEPEQQGVEPAAEAAPVNTVTITFDGNGATGGSMEPQAFAEGSVQALSANAFTRDGYLFLGWDVAADGSAMGEDRFLDGEAVEVNSDVTLYAQWREINADVETQQTEASAETVSSFENVLNAQGLTELDPSAMVVQNVTPLNENGEKMSNEEVAARGGVIFDMPLPDTYEEGHEIEVYHQNSETGEWERVTTYTVQGDKVVVCLKHFSPVVTLDRTAIGGTLSTNETPMLGAVNGDSVVVTLNANGGKIGGGEQSTIDGIVGNTVTLPKPDTRDGYKFLGWCPDKDGHDQIFPDGTFTVRGAETLYAQWAKKVTIEYKANNGGTGFIDSVQTYEGEKITLADGSAYTPTVAGTSFKNWNTKYDGTGTSYEGGAEITVPELGDSSVLTLYAQWEKTTFHVKFDKNEGTGTMAEQTTVKGSDFVIPEKGFTRDNYTFKGWNTKKDGTGDSYADKETIPAEKITDDFTLYAQWEQTTFTIKFDKNTTDTSVTQTMEDQTVDKGAELTLNENKFRRTNYTFMGWSTTASGSVAYGDKANIPADTITKDTTLYAVWKQTTFTINFSSNGGSNTMAEQTIDKADPEQTSLTLNPNVFTKVVPNTMGNSHYTFMCWNTKADGSGDEYEDEETIPAGEITEDMTLYAQWDTVIVFDKNHENATGTMTPQKVTIGEKTAIKANDFKRTNYTFNKWTTEAEGGGTSYADQGDITVGDPITLYAQWIKTEWSITYDKNGGGGTAMSDTTVSNGDEGTVSHNTYNAPDTSMIFGEWQATAVDEEGNAITAPVKDKDGNTLPTTFAEGDSIQTFYVNGNTDTDPVNIVMKAIWKDKLAVWFNPGDGSGSATKQDEPKDSEVDLPDPKDFSFTAPAGQTFKGWQVGTDTSKTYKAGDSYTFTEPVTVTAIWADSIKISYDPNGGTLRTDAGTFNTARSWTIPKDTAYTLYTADQLHLTRDGYQFEGWMSTASGSTIKYTDGQTIDEGFSQNTTIYAKWKRVKIADTVTISGSTTGSDPNAIWGETLTATVVDPVLKTGFTYTWKVGDDEVQTGESNTLEVKPEYYGKEITCTVTHPQAENEVVSNIKTVGVYAVEEDGELRIVNSRAKYPGLYYEVPLIFGAMPGTTYYKDGKAATVPESAASGTFEITEPGVYVFGDTTYVATQWWTIGYSSSNGSGDNSGSGTTTMKRGSTTLSGSTRIKSGDVTLLEPYNTINGYSNVWLVRDGSGITDITLTVRPSSGSYGHVSRNGSGFSSSNAERIISLGTIDEPELYEVIYNKSSSSPRTGDMSNLGLWSALCLVSFVGVTTILTSARKRKNRG